MSERRERIMRSGASARRAELLIRRPPKAVAR